MPRPETRRRQPGQYISLVVSVELRAAAERIARQESRTLSNVLRLALNEYIRRYEQSHPELKL